MHFIIRFIMLYAKLFALQDCSAFMQIESRVYVYVCLFICVCVYVVCVFVRVYDCVCICACMYIHIKYYYIVIIVLQTACEKTLSTMQAVLQRTLDNAISELRNVTCYTTVLLCTCVCCVYTSYCLNVRLYTANHQIQGANFR